MTRPLLQVFLLSTLSAYQVSSFVPLRPRTVVGSKLFVRSQKVPGARKNKDLQIEKVQEQWVEEEAFLTAFEHSLEEDHDLENVVDHTTTISPIFMEKESHRHDSLLDEIEHSIDSDADLDGVVSHGRSQLHVNEGFMEREAHKHDSLLNEIEHSISTDPDL